MKRSGDIDSKALGEEGERGCLAFLNRHLHRALGGGEEVAGALAGEEYGVDFGVDDRGGFPDGIGDGDAEQVVVAEAWVVGAVLRPVEDGLDGVRAEEDEEGFDREFTVGLGAQEDELGGANGGHAGRGADEGDFAQVAERRTAIVS